MAELIGTTLEGYRIEAELGRGGQAVVYRATQESLQRTVALKVVSAQLSGDPGFMDRFKREGISAASLDHPHIIPVYEAGEGEGLAFLAMKFVEGPSLDGVIRRDGALAIPRALALLRQVAEALDEIHRRDFLHRDVKPANILIGPGDHAYLSDFGLSQAVADARLTGTGVWMGTFEYVSPEQIQGGDVTSAADRYSFGAVVYEALTGRPPFEREDRSAMLYAHLNDMPPPASSVRPKLGTEVDAVIERSMAKTAAERFPSNVAMVEALAAAVSSTPGAARPTDPPAPTVAGPTAGTAAESVQPTEAGAVAGVAASSPPSAPPPTPAPTAAPDTPAGGSAPPPAPSSEGGRPSWFLPAVIGGAVAAVVVVVVLAVVLFAGGGDDEPELVLVPPGPSTGQPIGQIVPEQLPRWRLSAVEADTLNLNLPTPLVDGAEAAQASRGTDVGLLLGLTPAGSDVVGAIEQGIGDSAPRSATLGTGEDVEVYDVEGGVVAISESDGSQFVAVAASQDDAVDLLTAVAEVEAAGD